MTKRKKLEELIENSDLKGLKKFFKKVDVHYDDDFTMRYASYVGLLMIAIMIIVRNAFVMKYYYNMFHST